MATTYTEKEVNKMKNYFLKKVKTLETKLAKATAELKEVKADYEVLLETTTEKLNEDQ